MIDVTQSTQMAEVVEADQALWAQYEALAVRAYGHAVTDLVHLRPHADARVALRGDRVVAGGLGVLVPQFFGGRPVGSACMAAGCVAPEERGSRLTVRMLSERIRPLAEAGAALAAVWTTSTGYGHRLGWAAPARVFSWTVPIEELRRSFTTDGFDITHGAGAAAVHLQRELAGRWNGPWQRPPWWQSWQEQEHPALVSYQFTPQTRRDGAPAGLLSLGFDREPGGDRQVVVHDFWAETGAAAAAMLAFVGRHHSRIPAVKFERTGLPPDTALLEQLHRVGSASARHWHPWMLKILDPAAAVRARGWPAGLTAAVGLEIVDDTDAGAAPQRYVLRIADGSAELEPTTASPQCSLTPRQFAMWYAGGYRTATAAALGGVTGPPDAVADLIRATSDREPWLSEYF